MRDSPEPTLHLLSLLLGKRAARRQVTTGPLPPTMIGTRGDWRPLGTLTAPSTRSRSPA